MKRLLTVAFAFLATAAVAATPPATPPAPAASAPLDCARGFERLTAAARAEPAASAVQAPPGSTMEAVSVQRDGVLTVYNYTRPNHAAHPFIARRRMVQAEGRVSVEMSTCPYGDKAQGVMLEAQFKRMNDAFVRQVSGQAAPAAPAPPTK